MKKNVKEQPKRYYRKRVELFKLIDKIKLWPARSGTLHGIKFIQTHGEQARITGTTTTWTDAFQFAPYGFTGAPKLVKVSEEE